MRWIFFIAIVFAHNAFAQTKNPNLNYVPPPPKSDFQRALDNPIKPPPPPTALQALERGKIPTDKNPMPPPREGLSPTVVPLGAEYRKTFK